ncbi:uncharacterized protein Z519_06211 [Cladophialophora bantiana CBS 173.52]|uniref:Beta-lactamase-related domain-containing protein n=1 Tax=Cladophialophora bantiana (strain ATCC 10958 / CBS 173.52 / CDC B-1940 / NIH 8579) TaxID=1442370 RepID=A0A0D2EUS8_CLAB1|nr:uncharacterized protein Z519_06211 [Cladophialophora bantiana CBS 173.52]KIW93606.1 hypothetical protein Z519_06211 [Cladophialophora bantiana CBS 173.52]
MGVTPLTTSARVQPNFLDEDFAQHVRPLLEELHIPGLSIGTVDAGRVSAQGYGLARFPDIEANSDTLYYVDSTTKAMVAAATGVLIHGEKEESHQSLLATRTDGQRPSDQCCRASSDSAMNPEAIVQAYQHVGYLTKLFRTSWQYNNMMYSVVADALMVVTSLDCGRLLKKLIWDPPRMTSTYWRLEEIPTQKRQKDLARAYYWVQGGKQGGGHTVGHGIHTMDSRAAQRGQTIQGSSELEQRRVITKELFKELATTRSIVPEEGTLDHHRTYALGWMLAPLIAGIEHPIMCHGGGLNGFGTQVYILPNDDFGVVTMGNTATSSSIVGEILALGLVARKLDLDAAEKDKFVETLRAKLPPDAAPDTAARAKTGPALPASVMDEVAGNFCNPWSANTGMMRLDASASQSTMVSVNMAPLCTRHGFHIRSVPNEMNKEISFPAWKSYRSAREPGVTSRSYICGRTINKASDTWAAVKLSHEEAAIWAGTTSPSCILGMRLLSSLIDTDGDDEAGWEEKMVWFTPVTKCKYADQDLWPRIQQAYKVETGYYQFVATLSYGLLWLQIAIGATVTAIGSDSNRRARLAVTILGAINTFIAGILTFLKSRDQPNRALQFRNGLRDVCNELWRADAALRDPPFRL